MPPPPILRLALNDGRELVLSEADGRPGMGLLHITELDLGFPEVREVADPRPLANGTIDQTRFWGSRAVTLTGKIAIDWQARRGLPRRRQQVMDALAPFLMPGARPWLYSRFDDGTVKRIQLRADTFSRPQIANVQDIQIGFKSPTGVLEDDPATTIRLLPEVGVAGRHYNLEHNREYPSGTGTAWIATNRGNAPADWTCRVFGPVIGPAIVNVGTGEAVDLPELELTAGEFVDISSREHTVLADGLPENSRWQYVDYVATTWWQLPPGSSWLRFHCHWWEQPAVALFTWRNTSLL